MMLAFGSRCSQILGQLDSVARHAIQRDVRRVLPVTTEGTTRAALIPLHDREVRLVRRELRRERRERDPGAAVDVQQDGVAVCRRRGSLPTARARRSGRSPLLRCACPPSLDRPAQAVGCASAPRRKRQEGRRDRYTENVAESESSRVVLLFWCFEYGLRRAQRRRERQPRGPDRGEQRADEADAAGPRQTRDERRRRNRRAS